MKAVKDICRTICYYRKGETNSFFPFPFFFAAQWRHSSILIRRVPGPHLFSVRCWVVKACFSFILSIHHTQEEEEGEDTPSGASWVILRGRKCGDSERMVAGPFVIYCSLSPSAPGHTHTIYEDNRRARCARLEHSLMDVHVARRGAREGGGRVWKTKIEVGCLTVFITVN